METNKFDTVLRRIYPVVLTVALFTGFGNMPIYKRYYIANIPGLGWSGNFYINLYIHYIAGALLLAIATYFTLVYLRARLASVRLTLTGVIRSALVGLALLTGILLAVRNLSTVNFPLVTQMSVSFIHLGMAMFLMLLSIGCGLMKRRWTR
jgi:hypothetical protein